MENNRRLVTSDDIIWPVESDGRCRNHKNCHNLYVPLANGVCVRCWDRGIGKPFAGIQKGRKRVPKPKA